MAGADKFDPKYWDAEKMLDIYIHDYLVKRNLRQSAAIFALEANLDPKYRVAIDISEGFLKEWWSFVWDMYSARARRNNGDIASSSVAARRTGDELQFDDLPELKRQRVEQSPLGTDITAMLGQQSSSRVPPLHMHSSHQQMQVYNMLPQQDLRVDRSGGRAPFAVDSTPHGHGAINPTPPQLNAGK